MITLDPWDCAICGHHEDPGSPSWPRAKAEVPNDDGVLITVCDRCAVLSTIVARRPYWVSPSHLGAHPS